MICLLPADNRPMGINRPDTEDRDTTIGPGHEVVSCAVSMCCSSIFYHADGSSRPAKSVCSPSRPPPHATSGQPYSMAHTGIQWPMRRRHAPLSLPWHTRPGHAPYRRAGLNGTLGLSATTRLDVSQRSACNAFTLHYEFVTHNPL